MSRLVPDFIAKCVKEGRYAGSILAYSMFVDISGFTDITQKLMKNGKEGAEVLCSIINRLFEPSIKAVHKNGGFISSFAGDAFTAVFACESANAAYLSAKRIMGIFQKNGRVRTRYGIFSLEVKIGLSFGETRYRILSTENQKLYYFYGDAIDGCASSEHKAGRMKAVGDYPFIKGLDGISGYIEISDEYFQFEFSDSEIRDKTSRPLPETENMEKEFLPEAVLKLIDKGEFRDIISCFIGFSESGEYEKGIIKIAEDCHRYGGYLNRVDFGDKGGVILVLFGAPLAKDKLYQRAMGFLLAVSRMQGFISRIGVASGTAFAGFIGSDERAEYSALGSIVNLSARLMMKAEWGKILISSSLKEQIKDHYFTEKSITYKLKGFKEKRDAYVLGGEINKTGFLDFTGSFVGRENEGQILRNCLMPVFKNRFAGIIYIEGPAGIGKTRFLHNFLQNEIASKASIFMLPCDNILKKPFYPFSHYFKAFFNQDINASNDDNIRRFIKAYRSFADSMDRSDVRDEFLHYEYIFRVLAGLETGNPLYEQLDAKQRYENTVYAVKQFFKYQSSIRPVVLVFEDGHNIDGDSLNIMKSLVMNIQDYPIAIIANCRTRDDGTSVRFFREDSEGLVQTAITVESFNEIMMEKYLKDILKTESIPEHTRKFIGEKSSGNPFIIEQFAHYLQENRFLDKSCNLKVKPESIPSRVSHIITARIDRLSSVLREVIRNASVLGKEFAVNVLGRMLFRNQEVYEEKLPGLLERGASEQIWQRISELEYIFKHSIIRDTVYESILKDSIRKLHKLAGEVIEEIYEHNLTERYDELAEHFEKGKLYKKAVSYMEKAGEHAIAEYKNERALYFYDKILRSRHADKEMISRNLNRKGLVLEIIGKWQEAEKSFRRALYISEKQGLTKLQATSLNNLASLIVQKGKYSEANRMIEIAINIAEEFRYDDCLMLSLGHMGGIHFYQGRNMKALECCKRQLDIALKNDDKNNICRAYGNMGHIFAKSGDYSKAAEYHEKELKIARSLTIKSKLLQAMKSLGIISMKTGNYDKAEKYFKNCMDLATEFGDISEIGNLLMFRGTLCRRLGKYKEAIKYYTKQLQILTEIGDNVEIALAYGNIGTLNYFQGNYSAALRYYEKQLKMTGFFENKTFLIISYTNIGAIYALQGKYKHALKFYGKGIRVSLELGEIISYSDLICNIGEIHAEKGRYRLALKCYDKAIQISVKNSSSFSISYYQYHKAKLLYNIGDMESAERCNNIASRIGKENNLKTIVYDASLLSEMIKFRRAENNKIKEECIRNMRGMINDSSGREIRANILYEIFLLNKDNNDGREALKAYNALYRKIPRIEYKRKIGKLKELVKDIIGA